MCWKVGEEGEGWGRSCERASEVVVVWRAKFIERWVYCVKAAVCRGSKCNNRRPGGMYGEKMARSFRIAADWAASVFGRMG